jgi:hypothetical protein
MGRDAVAEYLELAEIPRENAAEVEQFLRLQDTDSNTLAVLERPGQAFALLKIHAEEATLFSFTSEGERSLVRETYIGKAYDATVTKVHAIENLTEPSLARPERVEIVGSRLAGTIDLTHYTSEDQSSLMDVLQRVLALPS